jgi:hypothetical protein
MMVAARYVPPTITNFATLWGRKGADFHDFHQLGIELLLPVSFQHKSLSFIDLIVSNEG